MKFKVTRFVHHDESHNYANRDVDEGEVFYKFERCTYGCVDENNGIAVSETDPYTYPFFEFPRDALEPCELLSLARASGLIAISSASRLMTWKPWPLTGLPLSTAVRQDSTRYSPHKLRPEAGPSRRCGRI